MPRMLLVTVCGVVALCLAYGGAMVLIPWFDYKAAARTYPYVARISGAVLLDDTGNPLRFRDRGDAEIYAKAYLCSDATDQRCRSDLAGASQR